MVVFMKELFPLSVNLEYYYNHQINKSGLLIRKIFLCLQIASSRYLATAPMGSTFKLHPNDYYLVHTGFKFQRNMYVCVCFF